MSLHFHVRFTTESDLGCVLPGRLLWARSGHSKDYRANRTPLRAAGLEVHLNASALEVGVWVIGISLDNRRIKER